MKATLNIGRGVEINGIRVKLLGVGDIVGALEQLGEILSINQHQSDSEPTIVAVIDSVGDIASAVEQLCVTLQQDAIPYVQEGHGNMVGPKAEAWGPFNPEYYITPDGTRLA